MGKEDMNCIALINNIQYVDLANKIGSKKIDFLKSMEEKSFSNLENNINVISENLFGYVFWYFTNIFNENNKPYIKNAGNDKKMEKQIEIAKAYCRICEIVN